MLALRALAPESRPSGGIGSTMSPATVKQPGCAQNVRTEGKGRGARGVELPIVLAISFVL